jgi:osomolarity two-component system sensor histidine kinase NIK1
MVRQLTTFANEVTRVALEVGTQGILGGQAVVEGVEGVWEDLTTNVNVSPGNRWSQIVVDDCRKWRGISPSKCEKSPKW